MLIVKLPKIHFPCLCIVQLFAIVSMTTGMASEGVVMKREAGLGLDEPRHILSSRGQEKEDGAMKNSFEEAAELDDGGERSRRGLLLPQVNPLVGSADTPQVIMTGDPPGDEGDSCTDNDDCKSNVCCQSQPIDSSSEEHIHRRRRNIDKFLGHHGACCNEGEVCICDCGCCPQDRACGNVCCLEEWVCVNGGCCPKDKGKICLDTNNRQICCSDGYCCSKDGKQCEKKSTDCTT